MPVAYKNLLSYKFLVGKENLENLGGQDGFDEGAQDIRSCDKRHHLERSVAHQPNHLHYWRGRGGVRGPQLEQPDPETHGRLVEDWLRSHIPIIKSRDHKGET